MSYACKLGRFGRMAVTCGLAAAISLAGAAPALAAGSDQTAEPVAQTQSTGEYLTASQFLDKISDGAYSTDRDSMASEYGYKVDGSGASWANIDKSIDLLESVNRMRAGRGLSQLDVDLGAFWGNVLEADINDSGEFQGHSDYLWYPSGRNLAWGQDTADGAVSAWMSEEAEYKRFVAANPDAKGLDFLEFAMTYPEEFFKVGHFLNLTRTDIKYQGGAYAGSNAQTESFTNMCWSWSCDSSVYGEVVSVAELRKMVDAVRPDELMRCYNPQTGEHLYTTHPEEVSHLVDVGWNWEATQTMNLPRKSSKPVWRVYNPATGDHHYTADAHEAQVLTSERGWVYDFSGDPAFYSADKDATPVYRIYDRDAPRFGHLFTSDANEKRVHLGEGHWNDENVGWYSLG